MLSERDMERYRRQAVRMIEQQLDNNTTQAEDAAERMGLARLHLEAAQKRSVEPLDPLKCPRCKIWEGNDIELVDDACPVEHCPFDSGQSPHLS